MPLSESTGPAEWNTYVEDQIVALHCFNRSLIIDF